MINFDVVKIGEIGKVVTGKTPKTSVPEYYSDEYMFIGPTDLHKHFVVKGSEKMISATGLQNIKGSRLQGTSILVGCIGWDMGNVAITESECATNQQINSITNIKNDFNPYYIYYWLKTKKDFLFQQASVTRTPILNKTTFSDIDVNIPSKSDQDSVVDILKTLDEKIELNNKINAELEAMAKLIYDYWFVQFDFPDANGKPYKSSGGKMIYNEELKREIPDGWGVDKLSHNLNIYDSMRIPMSKKERETKKGNYPYYGATSIMDYVDGYIFDDEYILVAEDGSIMDGKGMPIVQFIWGKSWVNNHAHVLQAKDKKQNEFYFQTLKRVPVVLIKTGSIQLKINQANLMNYKVLSPSELLINKYSELTNDFRSKLVINTEEIKKLTDLRDWLLPMLMNGQVTVKMHKNL